MDAIETVQDIYPRLIEGDIGVLSSFCERATVDSPLGSKQLPPEFVGETRAWLASHDARSEELRTTVTEGRIVHELTLWLAIDGHECELPVLLVADIADDCIRDLRVYHSTWPLYGTHQLRPPVLARYGISQEVPEPVGSYHRALSEGDAAAADATFEADGSAREPAGSAYLHTGADRADWYRLILSDGGIPLQLGSVIDDGVTVVYEYEVERWGSERLSPQAGAAAYTRGPSGKIASARIYDDVTPPSTLSAG
jgi:hypothetical protein